MGKGEEGRLDPREENYADATSPDGLVPFLCVCFRRDGAPFGSGSAEAPKRSAGAFARAGEVTRHAIFDSLYTKLTFALVFLSFFTLGSLDLLNATNISFGCVLLGYLILNVTKNSTKEN